MNLLKKMLCRHPFLFIGVQKKSSRALCKDYPRDFVDVTHHLYCRKCNKKLDLRFAEMIGGVDEFLERGRKQ